MSEKMRRACWVLSAVLLTSGLAWSAKPRAGAKAPRTSARFTLTDLGAAPATKFEFEEAVALSDAGDAVAGSFLWRKGKRTSLGRGFVAAAINDKGEVVGKAPTGKKDQSGDPIFRAVRWRNGETTDLGAGVGMEARGINNRGEVILGEGERGYLWREGAKRPLDIGEAVDINDRGWVLGEGSFLGENGKRTELAGLFPEPEEGPASPYVRATAFNNRGQACGYAAWSGPGSAESPGPRTACLWPSDGAKPRALGHLPGREDAAPDDINDAGQIVGACGKTFADDADRRAFLWENGVMHDLNRLIPRRAGWVLRRALAINHSGQIAGLATLRGRPRVFLLTPTR